MSRTMLASGNIIASRFVIQDSSNQYQILQASSATAAPLFGISQAGTRYAPWGPTDTNLAAIANENCEVFNFPDKDVMVEAGAAFSPGAYLTSDSVGRAIGTTTATNQVGAIAMGQALAAGDLVPVIMLSPTQID